MIELPAWFGEFGWEVMTWVPFCRGQAAEKGKVIVTSFAGMGPLYDDFATEFREHNQPSRSLEYPKMYRPPGAVYRRYGNPHPAFDVLIHARSDGHRKNSINYRAWPQVVAGLDGYRLASIGTQADRHIEGTADRRGIALAELLDLMAGALLTIGGSSGPMHLAAACGCDLVVWGDTKTRFWETLETRYRQTWNPFGVRVGWIDADDWQPDPQSVTKTIKAIL